MINNNEAIIQGDTAAFGHFFRSHYPRLMNYCKLFIKDANQVEDVVQEAFLKLWEKRHTLKRESSLEAFLFISLRNQCLNYLRDQKSTRQKLDNYKEEIKQLQFLSTLDYLGQEDVSVEELLFRELHAALDKLPPRCRLVIELSKFEGFTHKEVAVRLNITVKAVERQLSIGKQKITEHFNKSYPLGLVLIAGWIW